MTHGARRSYGFEAINTTCYVHGGALLLTRDVDALRDFMSNSLAGAALDDEAVRTGIASYFRSPFCSWKTDEGYCSLTLDTAMHQIRGLAALAEEDTDVTRAALRAWLPPTAELLRITNYEVGLLSAPAGPSHPALLCSRLHGERLGNWKVAEEVAEGVLRIEQFNPLLRIEALRLLGRAKAELGERAAACQAVERAVAEAVGAKYMWLEMLSLHDLLKWSEAGAVEGVVVQWRALRWARLRVVVSRMSASVEELAAVLGDDVMSSLDTALPPSGHLLS